MKRFLQIMAIAATLGAAPVHAADPHPQLVLSVQQRLDGAGYAADVSRYDVATVAALHLALSGNDPWFEKNRRINAILMNPGLKAK
ncbi:hypothetical protein [Anianabacter salinae]|uniref:hypothetical protein n=1 Tax=Anianabacter salinae TaxID=2851023 RepID=UPI00225E1569|nr:hypothetical protein [Anianabacter salinae]MBV0910829.1 hypothetical protein [Anianabacter salinae]